MTNDHPPLRRRLLSVAATALAMALPAVLLAPSATAKPPKPHFPTVMALPNGWLPEGIATVGHTAYFGSRADGDIYRLDLRTGQGSVISQGPGTPSVGVKAGRGLLWVAGGPSGSGRVVNLATGAIAATLPFTSNPSFVNDVRAHPRTPHGSPTPLQAQLYRVPLGRLVALHHAAAVAASRVQGAGANNANGISTTPDGRALLVVNSSTGTALPRRPGQRQRRGRGLATSCSTAETDCCVRAGRCTSCRTGSTRSPCCASTSGRHAAELADTITVRELRRADDGGPLRADRLYLPNARFTTPPTPDTTYTVVQVPISRAGGPGHGVPAGP